MTVGEQPIEERKRKKSVSILHFI